MYIHTQVAVYWRWEIPDTHTPIPTLDLGARHMLALPGLLLLHIQRRDFVDDDRHTYTHLYPYPLLIACTNTISPSCLQGHILYTLTHAALHATCVIISQVWGIFLVRDVRIADCSVRHLGVERPFSSFTLFTVEGKKAISEGIA